uniref:Large ribosomal subunit protein eL33 n=1 Tax=Glossina austeni TaxID=7395 RepID=A0A1A9UMD0_GLOAU
MKLPPGNVADFEVFKGLLHVALICFMQYVCNVKFDIADIQATPAAISTAKATKVSKTPKAAKPAKIEKATDVKSTVKYKRRGRLCAKAVEGCRRKEHGIFYVDKRWVYVYKAGTKKCVPQHPERKTRIRAVWGKVTRLHGNSGAVRARFRRNLPGHAMGHRAHIMLYPSRL